MKKPEELLGSAELLDKAYRVFDKAKTIQATVEITISDLERRPGQQITLHLLIENRADGSGYVSRAYEEWDGPGDRACIVLKDGKNDYVLDPDKKQYQKGPPTSDRFTDIFRQILDRFQLLGGQFKTTTGKANDKPLLILSGAIPDMEMRVGIEATPLILRGISTRHLRKQLQVILYVQDYTLDEKLPPNVFAVPKGYQPVPALPTKVPNVSL